ncbi:LysM peptidoglycan-binding domain-containing protein [Paenibacillus ihumii]|uniref:LysM peptidoglycan-binding domain-containing protein n=1 Tax=Paenibacillus ihumii TaxID=687436 RepID=UPI0006D7B6E9|nr:LysM peptidoglycan-binding domain-containing protein [Paenibacillus ihumii]
MDKYSLTLSFNNGAEAIEFPVLPGKIEVQSSGDSKTYDISMLGEINVIKNMKLKEIAFESFFPASWFPGVNVERRAMFKPAYYIDEIQKWQGKKRPVRLVLTGSNLNINMAVSIEKFSWSEEAGTVGDIHYQIAFKEYRFYAAKKVKFIQDATGKETAISDNQSASRADARVQPETYTLVAGDNLWKVAKQFLGDGSKYKQIQTLNGIKDSELKRLPIGKVIKLP